MVTRPGLRLFLVMVILVFLSNIHVVLGFGTSCDEATSVLSHSGQSHVFFLNGGLEDAQMANALSVTPARELTLSFDSVFPQEWISYAEQLYDVAYADLKAFNGPPVKPGRLTVRYDSKERYTWFDRGSVTIVAGLPRPPAGKTRDFWWDLSFLESVSRAFHGPIGFHANWAYGMHRAIADLVMMSLTEKGAMLSDPSITPPWMYNLKVYDSYCHLGSNVIGGSKWGSKSRPGIFWNAREGMFLLLTYSFPSKRTGQFDYLARALQVVRQSTDYLRGLSYIPISRSLFDRALDEAAEGATIDGLPVSEWVRRQPSACEEGASGPQLGVYFEDPDNPYQIVVFAFDRQFNPKNKEEAFENPINNLLVWLRVVDWKGDLVYSGNMTITENGWARVRPRWKLPEGAYTVIAEADYRGLRLSSCNYAMCLGPGRSIQSSEDRLYGVTLDSEGEPVSTPVTASVGTIEKMGNGLFTVRVSQSYDKIFQTAVASNVAEKQLTKPGPFTRIVSILARGLGEDTRTTVSGAIIDAMTKRKLPDILVRAYRGKALKASTISDSEGSFRVSLRGLANFSLYAFSLRTLPAQRSIDYAPSLSVVQPSGKDVGGFTVRLIPAALLVIERDIDLVEFDGPPTSVNFTVVDPVSGLPWREEGFLPYYGNYSVVLGFPPNWVILPAGVSVRIRVDASRRTLHTFKGFINLTRSFVTEEGFQLGQGQAVRVDLRRHALDYNINVVAALVTHLMDGIRKAEETGFYLTAEKRDLLTVGKLVSDSQVKASKAQYGDSFSAIKEAYMKAVWLEASLERSYTEAYWSALLLIGFLSFSAATLAFFMFDRSTAKLAGFGGMYLSSLLWFYMIFPGCRLVSDILFAQYVFLFLVCVIGLMFGIPKMLEKSRGMLASLVSVFSVAKRNLRRRRMRACLVIVTILVLVMSFVTLTSFSVEYGLNVRSYSANPPSDGILVREANIATSAVAPFTAFNPRNLDWISRRESVIAVSPKAESVPQVRLLLGKGEPQRFEFGRLISVASPQGLPLLGVVGITPRVEREVTHLDDALVAGSFIEDRNPTGILVSAEAARRGGFGVGESLLLSVSSQTFVIWVVGLLDDQRLNHILDLDGGPFVPKFVSRTILEQAPPVDELVPCDASEVAVLHYDLAVRLPGIVVSRACVQVADPNRLLGLARELALASDFWTWAAQSGTVYHMHIGQYLETKGGFLIVPLALVILNLGGTIYTVVYERRKEIFTLSSLGLSPSDIARIFLAESIVVGLVGSGIGYLAGLSFYKLMPALSLAAEVRQKISVVWSIVALVLAIGVALIGGVMPSRQASVIATPMHLMRWRLEKGISLAPMAKTSQLGMTGTEEHWSIPIPVKIQSDEVDRFMDFICRRLSQMNDPQSNHVGVIRRTQRASADEITRSIEFKYYFRGDSVSGFLIASNTLVVRGKVGEPHSVEIATTGVGESKQLVYTATDLIRKLTLEWSVESRR